MIRQNNLLKVLFSFNYGTLHHPKAKRKEKKTPKNMKATKENINYLLENKKKAMNRVKQRMKNNLYFRKFKISTLLSYEQNLLKIVFRQFIFHYCNSS